MQATVRIFQPKQKLLIVCLLSFFTGIGEKSWGQTTIVSDGLNGNSTLFTAATGSYYSTISASTDRPASIPFFIEGTAAYGVSNATATLTSSTNISTAGYTGIQLSVRLASFSISSAGNGADNGDNVKIAISTNSGTSYTDYLTVTGNGNAYWAYSATGVATTAFGTAATFAPSTGGSRTTDGYSTLIITNLPATTTLRVRITLLNNDVNERWVVDDFKITGTAGTTPMAYYWNGGNTTQLNGIWNNADNNWATTSAGTTLVPWPATGTATAYFNNTTGGSVNLPGTINVTPDATNIGSNGYTYTTGSADATLGGSITLNANTLNFAPSAGNITLIGNISGTGGALVLNSASTGNLNLSGTNIFTGGITASAAAGNQGRIRFDATTALPIIGTVLINTGGAIRFNNTGTFGGTGQALQLNPNQTTFPAIDLGISSGTVTWQGTVALQADSRIEAASGTTLAFTGNLSGTGKLIKQAGGTLALTGTGNTNTGGTQIGNGAITVASGCSLGTGDVTFAQTSTNNTAITLGNTSQTIGNLASSFAATSGTQTQTFTLTGTVLTINQSVDGTFGDGLVSTLSSSIAGTGSVIKTGAGALTLNSSNTYTGGTTITAGSIILGKGDILADAGKIVLNGGTFRTGANSGHDETVGTLGLTASSTIALGTGVHTITFASSRSVSWTSAATLTITGWTGSIGSSGAAGKIFVGTTNGTTTGGLTAQQLSQINFTGFGVGAQQLSNGEVVPAVQPLITAAPASLSGFTYIEGSGPSASQSFSVSGFNLIPLAGNLTVTGSTNYEVSINNTSFASSVTIAYTGGTLTATNVYVRLKSGLTAGSYNNQTITVSGGSAATSATVTVNGTVTPCTAPVTQATNITFTTITTTSFIPNWTAGSGDGRVVYINTTNTFTNPTDGTSLPTANATYSGTGQQAVYAGTGTNVNILGLTASTTYYVRVYEYKNCSGTYLFQTATSTDNPNSTTTKDIGGCNSLINENFDYGGVANTNLTTISGGNWTCFADCAIPAFNYSPSRGLVYSGYADGAVGGAANVVGANKTDISRSLSVPVGTTTLYMSFLMNFTSATTTLNAYFLTFKDAAAATNYYGKLAPLQTSSTTYSLGLTKYASVPAGAYSGTYQYGKTYLVVIKYTIVPGTGNNDSTKAWVFSSGVPASEPAPTYTATDVTSQQDAGTINAIILRQEAGIDGYIDGIRVATTWQDALCQGPITPVTYQWQPTTGSANFNTSTNWSPVRSAPLNTDILNFTKGGTSTATNVPGQGIGQMNVQGNTSISFSSAAASTFAINDDPNVTATDLTIDAGSSFIIDSDNPLEVNLVNSATAQVSGNITMNNTVGNTGRAHRFTSEISNGITFNSGSLFTAQYLTGSAFGSTTANSVYFLSGSSYIAGDGSNPFALTAPSSVVVFNSGSLYKHAFSSTTPAFANRTYGNFEYAATGTAAISLSGTNAATMDNFTISSGTLSVPNTVTQPFTIKGNISIANGATFNYSPAVSSGFSTILLSGTSAQTISGAGTFTLGTNSVLSVNNASGVSLSKDLTVGGTLNLVSGSFATGSQTLTLNGPAITGTPANLTTTSASSLIFGGASTGIIVPSSVAALNNLTINNTNGVTLGSNPTLSGALTLTNGPFITTGKTLTLNGSVSHTSGSITGSATSNLVLDGSAAKAFYFTNPGNVLHNVTINTGASNVSLDNALDITSGAAYGTVICNGALQTNGYLTLKSDIGGTAAVGQSSGIITGNVTVERYTDGNLNAGSSRRAWRLITSPVTGQTIRQAWQENGNNGTAFGTLITGENMPDAATAALQGYDFTGAGFHASIKHYVPVSGSWLPLSSDGSTTGTTVSLHTDQAYMLYVRGDRTIMTSGSSIATLRATGALSQGTQTAVPLTASTNTVLGNPYASSLDFASIYNHNIISTVPTIRNQFYLWNSKLGSYGAYVLVKLNPDNSGNYQAIPSAMAGLGTQNNDTYRYIPSGSGFFVTPAPGALNNSVVIQESDKAAGSVPPISPFRIVAEAADVRQLFVNLNLPDSDTSATLADGFVAAFATDYLNNEGDNSTVKISNFNENLGLVRNNANLIVEARGDVKNTDTLFMKLWNITKRAYQFQVRADHFASAPGIRAWLEDNYLGTKQELAMSGSVTTVSFEVNNDSLSWKSDRFMIVFANDAVLPVTITKVKATPANGGVEVSWTVTNETNVKGYTVEKSNDGGTTFTAAGTQQPARSNAGASLTSYAGFDATPKAGDNFYRIRIEAKDGTVTYSEVVKVTIGQGGSGILITLYPNPVRQGRANLQLTNLQAGTYLVGVYTGSGQTVLQKKVYVTLSGTTQTEVLLLGSNIAQGSYQIKLSNNKGIVLFMDEFVVIK